MLSALSFALYVLIVSCIIITAFSYKKITENINHAYYDNFYFVENGILEKIYLE